MVGCDVTPPKDSLIVRPEPHALTKLRRLHAAAGRLAEEAPEVIANPDAARGLEQAVIEAMAGCLGHREDRPRSSAQGQHAIIMRRFRRVVEENPEEALYIPEICKAIRVSDRTLRMVCQEHLGMGPKRYLLLRRMLFGAAGAAGGNDWRYLSDGNRDALWLLASGAPCGRVPLSVRRGSLGHPSPAI
jgi:hypothetical protein